MAKIGTYSWLSELEDDIRVGSAGLDSVGQAVQEYLDALNARMQEQLSMFAETSPDSRRVWTGTPAFEMVEVDEYSEAPSQMDQVGSEVAFPMRKKSLTAGFTNDALKRMTAGKMRQILDSVKAGYSKTMNDELAFAIYNNVSYNLKDKFGDGTVLKIKAALNADGDDIPVGIDGTEFDGASENHYHGTASLSVQNIDDLIADVAEHGGKGLTLIIPSTMITTLEGLTNTKFLKRTSNRIILPSDQTRNASQFNPASFDITSDYVGDWDGMYPVITRKWAKANFIVCAALEETPKPLLHRVEKFADLRGLIPAGDQYGLLPVFSKTYNVYHGIAVLNRGAIAVLDTNSASYTLPTLVRTVVDADA